MADTMIRDLTKGPVVSQLFRFALPLFASNALQAIYNLVDMVIVGNCIGAVTHVLLDDPAKGCGVSIDTMRKAAA